MIAPRQDFDIAWRQQQSEFAITRKVTKLVDQSYSEEKDEIRNPDCDSGDQCKPS